MCSAYENVKENFNIKPDANYEIKAYDVQHTI